MLSGCMSPTPLVNACISDRNLSTELGSCHCPGSRWGCAIPFTRFLAVVEYYQASVVYKSLLIAKGTLVREQNAHQQPSTSLVIAGLHAVVRSTINNRAAEAPCRRSLG